MINAEKDEVIPRRCTVKLAEAFGIADRVVWLEGLGHYTAMAELPRALRITADFFAQDLPEGTPPAAPNARRRRHARSGDSSALSAEAAAMLADRAGRRADAIMPKWKWRSRAPIAGRSRADFRLVRGAKADFRSPATCRKSERSPWVKAAFPGCWPAPQRGRGNEKPVRKDAQRAARFVRCRNRRQPRAAVRRQRNRSATSNRGSG